MLSCFNCMALLTYDPLEIRFGHSSIKQVIKNLIVVLVA